MILVDTSVWIDHFRGKESRLRDWLEQGIVLMHPFVLGELACGNLKNRSSVLNMMSNLPSAVTARDKEVLGFIEKRSLYGRGLGYIDMHLLAAAALTGGASLCSLDTRVQTIAEEIGVGIKEA